MYKNQSVETENTINNNYMSKTKEFIDNIISADMSSASSSFDALMRDKARTVLEIKRVELTSNIYNLPAKAED